MSKRTKTNSNGFLLALFFVGAVVVGALAFYVTSATPTERTQPKSAERKVDRPAAVESPQSDSYFVFDPEQDWAAVRVSVPARTPIQSLIGEFLNRVGQSASIQLLSADLKSGHAVLNFSASFDGMGSEAEGLVSEGILRILGQFPSVRKADFLNQGEPMETGHQTYTDLDVVPPKGESN